MAHPKARQRCQGNEDEQSDGGGAFGSEPNNHPQGHAMEDDTEPQDFTTMVIMLNQGGAVGECVEGQTRKRQYRHHVVMAMFFGMMVQKILHHTWNKNTQGQGRQCPKPGVGDGLRQYEKSDHACQGDQHKAVDGGHGGAPMTQEVR